jgi:hypothetical protein
VPQCPKFQTEVPPDYRFCPNCGTQLVAIAPFGGAPRAESGTTAPQELPRRSGLRIVAVAVLIVVLLVFVLLLPMIPAALHVSSSNTQTACPLGSGSSTIVSAPNPGYDVQEIMAFAQSYPQLEFNVTAVAQCDANGYGPAYLLNGLSNTGYWYQVGINWDWPLQTGGYIPGFGFVSEAWAPGGLTRSPSTAPFSGSVNPNDTIELSLSFNGATVTTSATDLNTGASASANYSANRATTFVGTQAQQSRPRFSFATRGYFTGLMTEWYHMDPNINGPSRSVIYSETTTPITSATLAVGEWDFTTSVPVAVFSDVANNGNPTDFSAQPNQFQQLTLNGYTLSADAYEFVTGT